jgi:2-methylfumaryl-CoA isomerase
MAPWFRARTLAEVEVALKATGVCWGPYQTPTEMLAKDPRASTANPLFSMLDQPGIGRYLVPGSPLQFSAAPREIPRVAPRLGEHTDEILSAELGMTQAQIGALRDKKVVGGPIDVVAP